MVQQKLTALLTVLVFGLFFAGCGTTGQDFDYNKVVKIVNKQSTKEDILKLFGTPQVKGVENGRDMWTYEYNKKYLGGKDYHKNIVLIFDKKGKVIAYNHESNFP